MNGHLWKLVLVVVLSHAYRLVGRTVGPRWAGLITALPCSTAIALVGSGSDRGLDYAVEMATSCWAGLAGASILPMAFASAITAGWGPFRATVLGIFSYFAVMTGVAYVARPLGGNLPVAVCLLGVATVLAIRIIEPSATLSRPNLSLSSNQVFWLRTAVPVACLAGVLSLGERLGPNAAGYLGTFPGMTLTSLVLTRMESGPLASIRMARALPPGNWAMVAFLTTFVQTSPTLGLIGGTAIGYASALICLGTVALLTNPAMLARLKGWADSRSHRGPGSLVRLELPPTWPRNPRRFSPLVESIAA